MSTLKVDKIDPQTGTALEIGSSGDTMTVPSGATFTVAGTLGATSAANLTSIPAANVTGTLPAISGANLTGFTSSQMPAGCIVQAAQTVQTATFTTTANAWDDITGMDVDITPSDSNNKMIVTYTINCASQTGQRFGVRLYRDSTALAYAASAGSRQCATSFGKCTDAAESEHHTMTYIDSPATDSQVTYFLKCWAEGSGAFYLNRNHNDSNGDTYYRGVSTITAMELQV
jgi:hypothetical protein